MLTELSLDTRLDRSLRDIIEMNMCKNSEVSCFRCLIGRAVKTYDYINRIVLMLPLSVYEGTWTHSPLSLLCITMILRVRRKFFEITTFPNTEPFWCPNITSQYINLYVSTISRLLVMSVPGLRTIFGTSKHINS